MAAIDTPYYSQSLDLLLKWGKIHLFQEDRNGLLRKLEKSWNTLEISSDSFMTDLEMLRKAATQSLDLLHGPDTVDLDPDDGGPIWSALKILDQVIYLAESLEFFPQADALPKDFQEKAEDMLHQATIDQEPPSLRLIPLNLSRRKILNRIPSEARYLFPWYRSWTEVPEDFLDMLAARWDDFTRGKTVPDVDKSLLNALLAELKSDHALLCRIRGDADVFRLLPQAVEESMTLRLFALSEEERGVRPVPSGVERKGLTAAACRAVGGHIRSQAIRTESLFLAAFCSPLLDDHQRLGLFSEVEKSLNPSDMSQPDSGSLIRKLLSWRKHDLSDEALAQEAFKAWEARLIHAASQIRRPIPDDIKAFQDAIENVRHAEIPAGKISVLKIIFLKIRAVAAQMVSPKIIAAAAAACLAIFLTIYNDYDELPLKSESGPSEPRRMVKKPLVSFPQSSGDAEKKQTVQKPGLTQFDREEALPEVSTSENIRIGDEEAASIVRTDPSSGGKNYVSKGKLDPFAPAFKQEKPVSKAALKKKVKEVEQEKKGEKKKRRVPRTPLERLDLSQLKLVAILRSESGNRALVQDASGKGHVVKKGTYIGIHGGRIVEISEDRVIIEEAERDVSDEIRLRRRELKLQKPLDENEK